MVGGRGGGGGACNLEGRGLVLVLVLRYGLWRIVERDWDFGTYVVEGVDVCEGLSVAFWSWWVGERLWPRVRARLRIQKSFREGLSV